MTDDLIPHLKNLLITGLNLEEMKPEDLDPDAPLFGDSGIGLDSVDALELVMELERQFGYQLQDDASSREVLTSIRTIAAWVREQQNA